MTQSQLQLYLQEQFNGKDKTIMSIKEDIFKTIKERWNEKLGYVPEKPMALITVHDPDTPNILASIGCSEPNDIITDNFGEAFAGMLTSGGTFDKNLTDSSGVVRAVRMSTTGNFIFTTSENGGAGVLMQIGQGGGIFARTDFALNNPFVVAPESNTFNVVSGGWLTGFQQVVVGGLLTNVTSSDVIGECGLFARWNRNLFIPIGQSNFLISHDVAGASFSSGQNINVTYTWSIT